MLRQRGRLVQQSILQVLTEVVGVMIDEAVGKG